MSFTIQSEFQPQFYALVPCAGVGARAGVKGPKQYHTVAGRAVVAHTLSALSSVNSLTKIVVVLAPDDEVFEAHVKDFQGEVTRTGGATRAESVLAGLRFLVEQGAQPNDWVLVHDAARCLIESAWVERLIHACHEDEVGGLLALPVADTLKAADDAQRVESTVPRTAKWAAQTPQMFRLGLLLPALTQAGESVTDEASAVEQLGHRPLLVVGDMENFKVTWPQDFALAERLLQTRDGQGIEWFSRDEVTSTLQELELFLMSDTCDEQHLSQAARLLSEEFVELGQSGKRVNREDVLTWLKQTQRPRYRMSHFEVQQIAPTIYLTRYQAHRIDSNDSVLSSSWRCGTWRRTSTSQEEISMQWELVAHQGTRIPTE